MKSEFYVCGYNIPHKVVDRNLKTCKRFVTVPNKCTEIEFLTVNNKLTEIFCTNLNDILVACECQDAAISVKESLQDIYQQEDQTYLIDSNGACHIVDNSQDKLEHSIVKQGEGAEDVRLKQVSSGDTFTLGLNGQCFAGCIKQENHDSNPAKSSYIFRPFTPSIICKQVSCGKEHGLLLSTSGQVYSFGLGSRGQLGHGVTTTQLQPKLIEAIEAVSMATISCGGWHSAAVSDIHDLYIWGWNESGQLGFKMKTSNKSSVKGQNTANTGSHDSSHDSSEGKGTRQMGDNLTSSESGCQGDDSRQARTAENMDEEPVLFHLLPEILDLPGDCDVSKVSCGSRHTAAVTDNGSLFTWGWGEYGQLGHGDTCTRDKPTLVQYFTENNLTITDVHCQNWTTVVSAECR